VVAVRPGSTLGLACNGGTDLCDAAETARIADLVGYGNANFFETAPTAVLTNTTSAKRLADGATDTDDNSADFTVLGAVSPNNCGADCLPPPPPADIVVSQLYGGGGNTGAPFSNDYIELFNRGGAPVSLSGWSVQYGSATGTTWQVTPLTGSIAAGRYYLVQEAAGTTPSAANPGRDWHHRHGFHRGQGRPRPLDERTRLRVGLRRGQRRAGLRRVRHNGQRLRGYRSGTGAVQHPRRYSEQRRRHRHRRQRRRLHRRQPHAPQQRIRAARDRV
jgi:hypothetical protein